MSAPKALLVMPAEGQAEFKRAVSGAKLDWAIAETCEAVGALLDSMPDVSVVVSDITLSDGNWYCVLERVLQQGGDPAFYVVVPNGCNAEPILEHGISGVLRRPLDAHAADTLEQGALEQAPTR